MSRRRSVENELNMIKTRDGDQDVAEGQGTMEAGNDGGRQGA